LYDRRRRFRFALFDTEEAGREHAESRGAEPGPSHDGQREEAQRRPHWGSSTGNVCRVLSHRLAPPPRWSDTARAAASMAMTLPTMSRGMERRPSTAP